jgi:hypothetical protein
MGFTRWPCIMDRMPTRSGHYHFGSSLSTFGVNRPHIYASVSRYSLASM